jgi:hypothetical protein
MPVLEMFCTIRGDMEMRIVGAGPSGMRIDFLFTGTATGPHWDGERPVVGVDYATIRSDGNMDLDIHATIGEKRESVAYRGSGVSIVHADKSAEPRELLTFTTGNEDLAWLNNEIGVVIGRGEGGKLNLEMYLVRPD